MQAELSTARLVLVPLADEHLAGEIELDTDAEVMRYLGNGLPRTPQRIAELHAERLAGARDGLGFWAGLHDGQFVGWWLLEAVDAPAQAELGYRLLPRFWRRGFAVEGARELVRYGFADLHLERIFALTMAVNAGSRATMARAGLRYARTLHEQWDEPIPGWEQGEVEYALTCAEWERARRGQ